MKSTLVLCFALLSACAVSQRPDTEVNPTGAQDVANYIDVERQGAANSLDVEEQAVPVDTAEEQSDMMPPVDMPLDSNLRGEEDERLLQNFRNVCCSQCPRYSGAQRLTCFDQCLRVCPTPGFQNFRNVCCSECWRYSGAQRLTCFNQCQRVCFSERQCVNAGRGVYAAWCQARCSSAARAFMQQVTPRQCTGACSSEVQTLCRFRCNDLFPGCNASYSACLSEASQNCFVG